MSLALLLAAPAPLLAQQAGRASTGIAAEAKGERLDELFADLKRARNEKAAERISNRIWREWNRSGSASIDLLMEWAQKAMDEENYAAALDFLDQVTLLAPAYAEGWNRRATLHFAMDDYAKSMADIARTLQLEPRHFGALGGMAVILRNSGNDEGAMRAYERVLDVYPMMRDAQTELGDLAEELVGQGI